MPKGANQYEVFIQKTNAIFNNFNCTFHNLPQNKMYIKIILNYNDQHGLMAPVKVFKNWENKYDKIFLLLLK